MPNGKTGELGLGQKHLNKQAQRLIKQGSLGIPSYPASLSRPSRQNT